MRTSKTSMIINSTSSANTTKRNNMKTVAKAKTGSTKSTGIALLGVGCRHPSRPVERRPQSKQTAKVKKKGEKEEMF